MEVDSCGASTRVETSTDVSEKEAQGAERKEGRNRARRQMRTTRVHTGAHDHCFVQLAQLMVLLCCFSLSLLRLSGIGVTPQCPQGQGWEQVEGALTTVSIAPVMGSQNVSAVWGTNAAGNIYVRRRRRKSRSDQGGGQDQCSGTRVSCLMHLFPSVQCPLFYLFLLCRCVRV